jgi:3-hydroxybutyryl-CoA dehydrogenase
LKDLIAQANKEVNLAKSPRAFEANRVILPMLNEAIYCIQEQVVEASDIDVAMQNGCGFKVGLMAIAKEKGLAWCLNEINAYHKEQGERFRPSWLLGKLVGAKVHDFSALAQDKNKKPVAVS